MRLLLVEDYRPLRESLAKGLREAGFAVDATGDGAEGLWYARGSDYDVIVLDLMLPGMDGLSILKTLRAEGRQSHVLILTAKDAVDDRITGLDFGADDYMVKPFAFRELLARVRALLRRSYRTKNPQIEIRDLRIDLAVQRVWRGGEEIVLTPREYALLEYLAMRAGQVVSRTDIWEHVYEFNSSASSNVVDVYIGYLRKKIERPDRPALINTIRGRGYTLGAEYRDDLVANSSARRHRRRNVLLLVVLSLIVYGTIRRALFAAIRRRPGIDRPTASPPSSSRTSMRWNSDSRSSRCPDSATRSTRRIFSSGEATRSSWRRSPIWQFRSTCGESATTLPPPPLWICRTPTADRCELSGCGFWPGRPRTK